MSSPYVGPSIGFLTWSSPVPTGGNVYDDRLAEALCDLGVEVQRRSAPGTWPADAHRYRSEVAETLRSSQPWLVDSIIACALPDLVVEAADRGHPPAILLHSLLSTELGLSTADRQRYERLESTALAAARRVITTSRWAAADLSSRYGIRDVIVARPGVAAARLVPGSPTAPGLLSLGSVTATKDQRTLVAALAGVADLPWSARIVGGDTVQPAYTSQVRADLAATRLTDRVTLAGALDGARLEAVWTETDLLVLTSRSETYGMVVVEALAHGVPAIVPEGTGAVEALGEVAGAVPGATTPSGDPAALATVLRRWLTEADLRRRWRLVARRRRAQLGSWTDCARTVMLALGSENLHQGSDSG